MEVSSRLISVSSVSWRACRADARIEARVLDADGDARGEQRQQALVLFVESTGLGSLDVEYADDLVFGDEWDGQLGVNPGSVVDDILLSGQVVDQHGFAALYGLSGDALADLDDGCARRPREGARPGSECADS